MDSLFGNRPFSMSALKDFSKLDQSTRLHLKKVYACLTASMLSAGCGSGVHLFTDVLKGGFLSAIASIGFLVALSMTPFDGKNQSKRMGFLLGFAFCTGLGLGPLMDVVVQVDPSIIPTAFFATTLVFVCFTLSALWAEQRSYLYLGGTLLSGLSILCFLSIVNLFVGAQFIFQVQLYGGLLLFCGFVLYDTQLIVFKCTRGDRDFVWHSVDLFLDFIHIFRRLMIILAQNKESKKRKN
ncbi:probable Bax inhibitor 1 [Acropora muricata]|uniref:probable Bax inhibitor 1 n=1 Tax=Acropora millepora TaxID=45264 RepID=UPI001CF1025C|nr:probable Bax inhibitor 1 [Acropora millepora]